MIKHREIILLELERYPERCDECPMFYKTPYTCHNERGMEAGYRLGYMGGNDMRDFSGYRLFDKCDIRNNHNVVLMKGECIDE